MSMRGAKTFWREMAECAKLFGAELDDLYPLVGLEPGSIKYMAENSILPDDEILRRFSAFSGVNNARLLADPLVGPLRNRREVLFFQDKQTLLNGIAPSAATMSLKIDGSEPDTCQYLAIKAGTSAMSRAGIFPDDTLLLRRQEIARDGDIVLATFDDYVLLRRARRVQKILWLEAEGQDDEGPRARGAVAEGYNGYIRIIGKVVSSYRLNLEFVRPENAGELLTRAEVKARAEAALREKERAEAAAKAEEDRPTRRGPGRPRKSDKQ